MTSGAPAPRRFVVIQIDGLSHARLQEAVTRGLMPATARLLRQGALEAHRIPVGLPTSTPAFQAAVMYGGPAEIPAFEFLDRETRSYQWFLYPWTAARVESALARSGEGILRDGRAYGCIFSGGAADSVLTLARFLGLSPGWRQLGLRRMLDSLLALGGLGLTLGGKVAGEVFRWTGRLAGRDRHLVEPPAALLRRVVIQGWARELFTRAVVRDVRAGVPALFVNFVDYDVPAHALGPDHPGALSALRAVDSSIRRIARAVRGIPGLGPDLFVLSDHGQVASVPFEQVSGGVGPGDAVLAIFGAARESPPSGQRGTWGGGLCVLPAGPNANVYVLDAERPLGESQLEARYPGVLVRLSQHPGYGLVLARGSGGRLVCYHRGRAIRAPLPAGPTGIPTFDRADRDLVVEGLEELLAMASSGDVVLFGHDSPHGCVSFVGERGSHAGPSEDELYGFLLAPPGAAGEARSIRHPRDLHALFRSYHPARRSHELGATGRAAPTGRR